MNHIHLQLFSQEAAPVAADPQAEFERLITGKYKEQFEEKLSKLEAETAALKEAETQRCRKEEAEKLLAKWQQQTKEAQELYPALNFEQELESKDFCDLLRAGIHVRTAFEIVHKDEIIPAIMHYTAGQVEQKLTNKLLSGARRPAENGGEGGPSVSKPDVSHMTREQRRDILKRVAKGEVVRF